MAFFLVLLAVLNEVNAHSWVERVSEVTVNGTLTGQVGYIRGNGKVLRLKC